MNDAVDELRATIDAQAERIRMLERQLEAKTNALEAATAALKARPAATLAAAPMLPLRERIRRAIIIGGGKLLPKRVKQFVKRFWDPWKSPRRVRAVRRLTQAKRVTNTSTFDVICFSIIDWDFRWQRPQQLMSQLADAGHRVFVFKTSAFLSGGQAYEIAPLRENVWEVTLGPPVVINVYSGAMHRAAVEWFPSMLDELRRELDIVQAVSIVQVATWREAAEDARRRFGWKIVYDCMDEWTSFPGMKAELLDAERALVASADLVTVSGKRLFEKWREHNAHVELIRNAADFAHFSSPPVSRLLGDVPRPIAGYFGAIAEWFDVALLAHVASQRPHVSFVIVGGIYDVDVTPLRQLPNMHLLGAQPYASMPAYLRDFDACLIPFVVSEITAATDPVKFYEYLSMGKPVVTTHMPELEPHRELLYEAGDAEDFVRQLDAALSERDDALRARRIEVAGANTWPVRAAAMLNAIANVHPRVSIIIVSYENRELTRACIDSVLRNSMHPHLEVIVVDNASRDGSAEMLAALHDDRVRVVLNRENAGFAAANNQALQMATGEYLVLLNNDTVVPRGWLPRLLRHVDDPEIGLACAVTNTSGNESRIDVPYESLADMPAFAEWYMREHDGERFDIRVAAMYCVAMRREVFERVGPLDEQFGAGLFEDDDYSHRMRLAGYRVVCAEDAFVHHVGQASFSKLDPEAYDLLWKRNQAAFEEKWGMRWEPHRARLG